MSKLSAVVLLLVILVGNIRAQRGDEIGFIFLPFDNNSGFQGKWELRTEVPRFLSAYTSARFGVRTVSPVVVLDFLHGQNLSEDRLDNIGFWRDLFERFGIRFLVAGSIEIFDVSRFVTGEPQIAGYEAFKGEVRITYKIFDLKRPSLTTDAIEVAKGDASGEFSDRSFVLTFLGKPTQRTIEYRKLDEIPFGSEDFNRTVIGQACLQMSEHFSLSVEVQLPILKSRTVARLDTLKIAKELSDTSAISFKSREVVGQVVFIDGDEAFVNVGSGDGIYKGMTASVFSQKDAAKKVGEIVVTEVRSDHFALSKINIGKGQILVKDQAIFRTIQ